MFCGLLYAMSLCLNLHAIVCESSEAAHVESSFGPYRDSFEMYCRFTIQDTSFSGSVPAHILQLNSSLHAAHSYAKTSLYGCPTEFCNFKVPVAAKGRTAAVERQVPESRFKTTFEGHYFFAKKQVFAQFPGT